MAGDDETEATAPEAADAPAGGDDDNDQGGGQPEGFDVDAAKARLEEVGQKIEEGRQGLDDAQEDETPSSVDQPIAEGEGAANAPPG